MGESVSGPWTCVFDLYIVDEIEKGVFMFLRLFIDVSVMLLKKINIQFFQSDHSLAFVDWVEKGHCDIRVCCVVNMWVDGGGCAVHNTVN
jgi:hypothetical protein